MRGQWLSQTRRLNRHYQSGGKGWRFYNTLNLLDFSGKLNDVVGTTYEGNPVYVSPYMGYYKLEQSTTFRIPTDTTGGYVDLTLDETSPEQTIRALNVFGGYTQRADVVRINPKYVHETFAPYYDDCRYRFKLSEAILRENSYFTGTLSPGEYIGIRVSGNQLELRYNNTKVGEIIIGYIGSVGVYGYNNVVDIGSIISGSPQYSDVDVDTWWLRNEYGTIYNIQLQKSFTSIQGFEDLLLDVFIMRYPNQPTPTVEWRSTNNITYSDAIGYYTLAIDNVMYKM